MASADLDLDFQDGWEGRWECVVRGEQAPKPIFVLFGYDVNGVPFARVLRGDNPGVDVIDIRDFNRTYGANECEVVRAQLRTGASRRRRRMPKVFRASEAFN